MPKNEREQSDTSAAVAYQFSDSTAGTSDAIYTTLKYPLLGIAGWTLFILLWHWATYGNSTGDVPGPTLTWHGLTELAGAGILFKNIIASLFRVGWGFTIAMAVGIPLGIFCGWVAPVKAFVNPIVQCLRPISPIAWLPIAQLMFGGDQFLGGKEMAGDRAAIFLIFLASFFPIVTATTSAVASIETKYVRSASNFGVTGLEFFRRVVVPAALPQILTGLRLALGIGWVVLVAAEMLGVQQGLGYQVLDARNAIRYDWVTAAMVVIGIIGILLDLMMSRFEAAALARRGIARR